MQPALFSPNVRICRNEGIWHNGHYYLKTASDDCQAYVSLFLQNSPKQNWLFVGDSATRRTVIFIFIFVSVSGHALFFFVVSGQSPLFQKSYIMITKATMFSYHNNERQDWGRVTKHTLGKMPFIYEKCILFYVAKNLAFLLSFTF